ncbi:phage tail protein I [Stenotrophomonas lactitubi]|uniref:phage tail protein I n=1 Tax=Stenotrophomonas lactitubi TaxID=2045214 RepID=UPI002040F26A|nr:phage tail protein I [Stenotrophomonas lactitubi]
MSSLLPPNATRTEVAAAETTSRLSTVPVPFAAALDPMRAPEDMLPWLAWWFSVDTWGSDWPIYVRRRTVQQSLKIHRRKGTVGALLDAIDAIGVPVAIEEWHQRTPRGEPYTFRALVNSVATPFLPTDLKRLLQAIEDNKNLRSHMTELVPGLSTYSQVHLAATTAFGREQQIAARYSDISLQLEALQNGEQPTLDAADRLHTLIHSTLPAQERTEK